MLRLAVGKQYRDAAGRTVTILADRNADTPGPVRYRFIGDRGTSYTIDGKTYNKVNRYHLESEL